MKRRVRIYVGCEGDSERSYVRWLQSRLDEFGLHIHLDSFIAGGGDPLAVIENSARECRRRQRLYGSYRFRIVMLDSDKIGETPERDQKIAPMLRSLSIDAILQVYDHEAFLLRHFDGHQRKRPAKGKSQAALKKVWPDYKKPADAKTLTGVLDLEALKRAFQVEPDLKTFLTAVGFKA